jgi:hypothetical protein
MAIESGRITLNGQRTTATTKIKNGDLICHMTHRHEPPVSGEEVVIVHEDADVVRIYVSIYLHVYSEEGHTKNEYIVSQKISFHVYALK